MRFHARALGALLVTGALVLTPVAAYAVDTVDTELGGATQAPQYGPVSSPTDSSDEFLDADGYWKTLPKGLSYAERTSIELSDLDVIVSPERVHLTFDYDRAPKFREGFFQITVDGELVGEPKRGIDGPGTISETLTLTPGGHSIEVLRWAGLESEGEWLNGLSSYVTVPKEIVLEDYPTAKIGDIYLSSGSKPGGFNVAFEHSLPAGQKSGAVRVLIDGELQQPDPIEVTGVGQHSVFVPRAHGTYTVRIDVLHAYAGQWAWITEFEVPFDYTVPGGNGTEGEQKPGGPGEEPEQKPGGPGEEPEQKPGGPGAEPEQKPGGTGTEGEQKPGDGNGPVLTAGSNEITGTLGDGSPKPAVKTGQQAALAATGTNTGLLIGSAAALLLAGAVTALIGRLRRA